MPADEVSALNSRPDPSGLGAPLLLLFESLVRAIVAMLRLSESWALIGLNSAANLDSFDRFPAEIPEPREP
jgi:hypothetical protein